MIDNKSLLFRLIGRQDIFGTNDGLIYWRIYSPLFLNELSDVIWQPRCLDSPKINYLKRLFRQTSPWWRHQMETFSMLLALCAGNSPVTGEFPPQRLVRWSFDIFGAWINGWVNNRKAGDFRRHRSHYDVTLMSHKKFKGSRHWPFVRENHRRQVSSTMGHQCGKRFQDMTSQCDGLSYWDPNKMFDFS